MVKVAITGDRRKREKLALSSGSLAVPPVYRSHMIGWTGSGNLTQNVTLPAGAVSGDLLILWGVGPGTITKSVNGGQTWTQVLTGGATASYSVWWAIFNGTLTTTTVNLSAGAPVWAAGLIAITTGTFNATTPMDVAPTSESAGAGTGVKTIPAITTVTDGALRVVLYSVQATTGTPATCMSAMPATQSIKYNTNDGWLGNAKSDALGTAVQTPAGTSAAETFTQNAGAGSRGIAHLAIRPL